jgi:hypothetical protein
MNEKVEFTPFTPEELKILDDVGVLTRETATGWVAIYAPKEVSKHACAIFFGSTEEEARKAAGEKPLPGVRADGPHFY